MRGLFSCSNQVVDDENFDIRLQSYAKLAKTRRR
jgi:hypothetical protein